jgi:hypothetical protein
MAFNYANLKTTARKLLANFGQTITFTRTSEPVYNNDTGEVESTTLTFSDIGVIFPFRDGVTNVSGSLIQAGDQEVFWQGTTAPIPTDKLTVAGVDYNVIAVMPIEPGGTNVLYQLQVRR